MYKYFLGLYFLYSLLSLKSFFDENKFKQELNGMIVWKSDQKVAIFWKSFVKGLCWHKSHILCQKARFFYGLKAEFWDGMDTKFWGVKS